MYILGILYSCNSTVCLLKDGEILSAVSEERFSRLKNDPTFPIRSIRWTMETAGLKTADINAIALSTVAYKGHNEYQLLKKFITFTIDDYVKEQEDYWKPKLLEAQNVDYVEVFKHHVDTNQFHPEFWKRFYEKREDIDHRIELLNRFYGGSPPKTIPMDHHRCHAAYAYYASPFRGQPCLVLTGDAFGDGLNATISVVKDGMIERVFGTDKFTVARLYKFMTLLMGMKPNEHEFKVMGLAPYAKEPIYRKPYRVFSETLQVDGLDFTYKVRPTDHYFYFKEKLEGCRFDGIAAGLQLHLEDILTQWVRNAVRKFGISRVVFSGGIAMNIKAMGKIADLPEIKEFYVPGSGTDASTAMGAAYSLYSTLRKKEKGRDVSLGMKPMPHLYLGPDILQADCEEVVHQYGGKYRIQKDPVVADVARLLSEGKVIARCVDRMEFGDRALGNRSILADPRNPDIVRIINDKIKNRDFWMPFAPVVLDTYVDRYLLNSKNIQSPHMTVGFDTTPEGQKNMPAALHPADRSARPQILRREDNPEYYELLSEFARQTGVGALLNTSFNLHGYPIVNTPQDAMVVMENSDLDGLLLPGILILRKDSVIGAPLGCQTLAEIS